MTKNESILLDGVRHEHWWYGPTYVWFKCWEKVLPAHVVTLPLPANCLACLGSDVEPF